MRVLLYEWNAYMQSDLEEVLQRMKIVYETFSCEIGKETGIVDDYFIRNFGRILREGNFDAVLSLNYWSSVAITCEKEHVPYIAWGYDCPLSFKILDCLKYPTSHLFVFDKAQYQFYKERQFENVYHIPLSVNVKRLDEIQLTSEEKKNFTTDISFVGNTYASDYNMFKCVLDEYVKGYFESLIETQYRIYGDYFIDDLIPDELLIELQERIKKMPVFLGARQAPLEEFRGWVTMMLAREITRRERILLISALSKRHPFKLFSSQEETILKHVEYCGTVSSHYAMPKVFKASKINLNITYKQITVGMPLRVLDIMGAGGFLLSNDKEDLLENFRPGVDCVIYESIEDAVAKAEYYLEHEEERQEIAHNGHEAVKRFSYENQLDKMFRIVFGDQYRQSSSSK